MDSRRLQRLCPLGSPRAGITLIEILVATGIVGVLFALAVAAVQRSRDAARRMQCASQVKQLALAITAFEAAHGYYPKRTVDSRGNRDLHQNLAGYIEVEDRTYVRSQPNSRRPNVAFLACPSDPMAQGQLAVDIGSYWMSGGLGSDERLDGVWGYRQEQVRVREIVDGLSNTALISEKLAYPDLPVVDWTSYPEFRNRILLTTPGLGQSVNERAQECEFQAGLPIQGELSYPAYTHVVPPNRNSCIFGLSGPAMMVTASSLHGSGVNIALADGSVRFVSDSIDRDVWHAIGKRDDGGGPLEW